MYAYPMAWTLTTIIVIAIYKMIPVDCNMQSENNVEGQCCPMSSEERISRGHMTIPHEARKEVFSVNTM